MLRWAWFTVTSVFAWFKSLGQKALGRDVRSDNLPPSHMELLHRRSPQIASRCKAQGIKEASGRSGFISVVGRSLAFTYNTWFGDRLWHIGLGQVEAAYLHHFLETGFYED